MSASVRAVLEEGVIVADDTSIGDEAIIKADVKIWPEKDHRSRGDRHLQHDLGREMEEGAF